MDFKQYTELAVRTESLYKVIQDHHEQSDITDTYFHSAIGIQTEVGEIFEALFIKDGELDRVNLREEIGDIMWYIGISCHKLGYYELDFKTDFSSYAQSSLESYAYKINYEAIELLDMFKKSLFYNKPLNFDIFKERIYKIFMLCGAFVHDLGSDIETMCEINIKKLQARYPEKFTTEHAVNRDLKTERTILES